MSIYDSIAKSLENFGAQPIICPNQNCGYKGPPKKKARGSILVGVFLCMSLDSRVHRTGVEMDRPYR